MSARQDTPAAVVYHASWPDQKIVKGTVADISQKAKKQGIEHTDSFDRGGCGATRQKGLHEVISLYMTDTVVIALFRFLDKAKTVAQFLGADVREYRPDIFPEIFPHTKRIVAIMSMGIVVRNIAPILEDKWNDPAVVVVSPDLAYAIPLIGGHHGANELARELSALGICPVITTATESAGQGFCGRCQ